jgi:triphosphoribosyl-dephospho-CoA synthase
MSMLGEEEVAEAYVDACLAELTALKPGNVHVHSRSGDMDVSDFRISAMASAPALARRGATVGERILGAIEATRQAVAFNTNLGIVLLCAPIAAAAQSGLPMRNAIDLLLARLSVEDADKAFRAIRLANPAGLGRVDEHDVAAAPRVTLLQAMEAAAHRDRIARAYCTGLSDLFEVGRPALQAARQRGLPEDWAVSTLYMTYLALVPDSHIERKHAHAVAEEIRTEAAAIVARVEIGPSAQPELAAFDAKLKREKRNPGTSADFTVATLFLDKILTLAGSKS